MNLPEAFLARMHTLLREEYKSYLAAMEEQPLRGIRLNTLKCTAETLAASFPFALQRAPFSPCSYYYPPEGPKVGALPLHHAGAFYSQEPSASSAVTALNPQPGDRVLDLCAAPGGKSSQIAACLNGEGLLWSNEIVKSRAAVLLSNLERMGVRNAVVSSSRPDVLCPQLAGYFDKVLVDAPCSGEGMFRRDPQAIQDWSEEHVRSCAVRQAAILDSAAEALRPGGILAYSTCTFSPEENEQTVSAFLSRHPDFSLCDTGLPGGRPGFFGMEKARRIFPMDGGEGHFVALLKKAGRSLPVPASLPEQAPRQLLAEAEKVWRSVCCVPFPNRPVAAAGEKLLLLPSDPPSLRGKGVLRAGIPLCERKGKRWEPCHGLFLAAHPQDLNLCLDFAPDDMRLAAFLRGEEIEGPQEGRGYCGVSVSGVVLGFGKLSGGRLKNHYPKGLRNH